jgi:hypothetical protein
MISSSSYTSCYELESDDWSAARQKLRRPVRPRWLAQHHAPTRGPRKAPLGIHARGSRRGTYKCLTRGKIRAAPLLVNARTEASAPQEAAVT